MNDFDALLRVVADQARAIGIPIAANIDSHVTVNRRAATRFGCCRYQGSFVIELSHRLLDAPEESCRLTLAHELLHTCPGCRNHGAKWKTYARKMNAAYGYHIARTGSNEAMGVAGKPAKYLLRCADCGAEFPRLRASRLTEHPERYHCKCGGVLVRVR